MDALYFPVMLSVGEVLRFLRAELPHPTYNHCFVVDELLSDLFLGFQFQQHGLAGPKAIWYRDGISFPWLSEDELDDIIHQASVILIQIITSFLPELVPGKQEAIHCYSGGENLLIYIAYDSEKHPHVSRDMLFPWNAIFNSVVRT
jgi:hypothetical protein